MKHMHKLPLVTVVGLLTLIATSSFVKKPAPAAESGIKWMSWDQMMEAQKKQHRKVVVDVYTSWCGWCKKMESSTFTDKQIANYVNENFYAVKFDAETKEAIQFKGKQYQFVPQGVNGYNELAGQMLNNQMAYPTTVYFDENMEEIFPVPGFEDIKMFETVLNFVASNSYKTEKYDQYEKTFHGSPR
jgi:thioredoxin-related protein